MWRAAQVASCARITATRALSRVLTTHSRQSLSTLSGSRYTHAPTPTWTHSSSSRSRTVSLCLDQVRRPALLTHYHRARYLSTEAGKKEEPVTEGDATTSTEEDMSDEEAKSSTGEKQHRTATAGSHTGKRRFPWGPLVGGLALVGVGLGIIGCMFPLFCFSLFFSGDIVCMIDCVECVSPDVSIPLCVSASLSLPLSLHLSLCICLCPCPLPPDYGTIEEEEDLSELPEPEIQAGPDPIEEWKNQTLTPEEEEFQQMYDRYAPWWIKMAMHGNLPYVNPRTEHSGPRKKDGFLAALWFPIAEMMKPKPEVITRLMTSVVPPPLPSALTGQIRPTVVIKLSNLVQMRHDFVSSSQITSLLHDDPKYFVMRPFAKEFIRRVGAQYELIVLDDLGYHRPSMHAIMENVDAEYRVDFLVDKADVDRPKLMILASTDLTLLGRSLDRTIFVTSQPKFLCEQPENVLKISAMDQSNLAKDTDMLYALTILDGIQHYGVKDARPILSHITPPMRRDRNFSAILQPAARQLLSTRVRDEYIRLRHDLIAFAATQTKSLETIAEVLGEDVGMLKRTINYEMLRETITPHVAYMTGLAGAFGVRESEKDMVNTREWPTKEDVSEWALTKDKYDKLMEQHPLQKQYDTMDIVTSWKAVSNPRQWRKALLYTLEQTTARSGHEAEWKKLQDEAATDLKNPNVNELILQTLLPMDKRWLMSESDRFNRWLLEQQEKQSWAELGGEPRN
jgi:NLI interacting factor-like phosphatase